MLFMHDFEYCFHLGGVPAVSREGEHDQARKHEEQQHVPQVRGYPVRQRARPGHELHLGGETRIDDKQKENQQRGMGASIQKGVYLTRKKQHARELNYGLHFRNSYVRQIEPSCSAYFLS